jgi:hypothetical protein
MLVKSKLPVRREEVAQSPGLRDAIEWARTRPERDFGRGRVEHVDLR